MVKYCINTAEVKQAFNGDVEDVNMYIVETNVLAGTYSGSMLNGFPQGSGNLKFLNGDEYIGEFAEGSIKGQGIYIDSKGNRYSGSFKNGKRWGSGRMQYSNGDIFEGNWFDGIWYDLSKVDPLFESAAKLIINHNQASTSLIQRKLNIGYERAGRIIDQLEAAGVVGPFEGSKGRELLIQRIDELEICLKKL